MRVDPPISADGPVRPGRPRGVGQAGLVDMAAATTRPRPAFAATGTPSPGRARSPANRRRTPSAARRSSLIRDRGTAYALHDRCPHRGVPLSLGNQQFPGTLSCAYHGWTFGLGDGKLCAVITDGPDSPIRGKVTIAALPGSRAARHGLDLYPAGRRGAAAHRRAAPRGTHRQPVRDGRPDRAAGRQLAVRRGERLRRGPRQVPAPHVAVAAVQDHAHLEHHPGDPQGPVDLPRPGRGATGRPTSPASAAGPTSGGGSSARPRRRSTSATPASPGSSTR